MRILVVSDSHGDVNNIIKAIKANPAAEVIIHCGDGDEQVQYIQNNFKDKMIIGVRGNCDWCSTLPEKTVFNLYGKRFFVTHGHLYNAKLTTYPLVCAAREENADILLFGHTHNAMNEYDGGLHIMNPGSCRGYYASYGWIDITDKGDIVTNIVPIK